MRYVLDASAALCWVLPRPNSGKALQLRADFQNALHELIAPSVFSGEVASALTKAERQKLIVVGDARPLLARSCDAARHAGRARGPEFPGGPRKEPRIRKTVSGPNRTSRSDDWGSVAASRSCERLLNSTRRWCLPTPAEALSRLSPPARAAGRAVHTEQLLPGLHL